MFKFRLGDHIQIPRSKSELSPGDGVRRTTNFAYDTSTIITDYEETERQRHPWYLIRRR